MKLVKKSGKLIVIFMLNFLLFLSLASAQEMLDVVETNDGSVYKGIIVENKINEFLRIELTGGSIIRIGYDNIDTIKKVRAKNVQKDEKNTTININSQATTASGADANADSGIGKDGNKTVQPPIRFHEGGFFGVPYYSFLGSDNVYSKYKYKMGYLSLMDFIETDESLPQNIDYMIDKYRKKIKTNRIGYWTSLGVSLSMLGYGFYHQLEWIEYNSEYSLTSAEQDKMQAHETKMVIGLSSSLVASIVGIVFGNNLQDPPNNITTAYNQHYIDTH